MNGRKTICIVLCTMLLVPVVGFAQGTPSCTFDIAAEVQPDGTILVQLNMSAVENLTMAQLTLNYDSELLTYLEGTAACGIPDMADASCNCKDGELMMAWDSTAGVETEGTVLQAYFAYAEGVYFDELGFSCIVEVLCTEGDVDVAHNIVNGEAIIVDMGITAGDADCDGTIGLDDAFLICEQLNSDGAALSAKGKLNAAAADGQGGLSLQDAHVVLDMLVGKR